MHPPRSSPRYASSSSAKVAARRWFSRRSGTPGYGSPWWATRTASSVTGWCRTWRPHRPWSMRSTVSRSPSGTATSPRRRRCRPRTTARWRAGSLGRSASPERVTAPSSEAGRRSGRLAQRVCLFRA
ncbi:hypothetical protein KTR9_2294 [Gordonia sp. KTR9]|nr:hypothetical protein KTR9_2294 [Gordonia sp. KTR9]